MKIVEVVNVDFSMRHFLLPLMRGIRSRGHEVVGACAEGPLLAEIRAEGFRVEGLPFERRVSPLAHLRAFQALRAFLRAEKPDLVHAHMPISGFVARLAARAAGVPRIAYTCHGFLFNQDGSPLRRGVSFAMEWAAGRMTDVFLTVNGEEADDARRLGISRRAVPVGNGRDPMVFRPDPAARARLRSELGTPDARVVITAASRLVRDKGYAELLEAMKALPQSELWVAGERLATDRGENLEALFAGAGLGERLRRLGYRSDIPAILAASDIFVLPSYFEAMPMSVIEAMLTGLPVVATCVRGAREQVVDGSTGLLVPARAVAPLATALARLADDPALRASMGVAGRARATALYDESRVVARTLDLLGL
jgi:glycosyltransferase involved in cell wall biosynthesis